MIVLWWHGTHKALSIIQVYGDSMVTFASWLNKSTLEILGHTSPHVKNSSPTSSHVRTSRIFLESIKSQTLATEEIVMSFDMVSISTCVPQALPSVACHRLENDTILHF